MKKVFYHVFCPIEWALKHAFHLSENLYLLDLLETFFNDIS